MLRSGKALAIELLRWARGRIRSWPSLALPALIVVAGLIMTVAGGYQIEQGRQAREQMRFDGVVDQANDAVAGRLETYIAVLRAGAGLFAASQDVSLTEFRAFAERVELTRRYLGVQGIGYSARVLPGEADALVARMHAEGESEFKLQDPNGEVHAIIYLEPAELREAVVAPGFNMHRFPVRGEAMDRARDTGLPALSGKVEVVQEVAQDKQAGFLIYEPVYRGGTVPETLAERREKLQGFVYTPFRAGDLLKSVLPSAGRAGLAYAVYDGEPSAETLLYHSSGSFAGGSSLAATRTLDIAGRTWTILYHARESYERGSDAGLTWVFLGTGTLVSLLIGFITWRQVSARLAAEREIVARIAAEAHQKLLLDELNHRVKNTLATVQSIAAQSLRHGADVSSVRDSFEARLIALSQAHNLLTRDNWRGASLAELVKTELVPYGGANGERMRISGQEVWLAPSTAVALGMAFHELATNAVKYGALSGPEGRVDVSWTVTDERQLRIVWSEQGGPVVTKPDRRGFGSRVIVGGLAHQLDGVVDLAFAPTGVVCTIVFKLPPSGAEEQMLPLGSAA